MKRVLFILLIVSSAAVVASGQSNKIVFGPLEGDDAGNIFVEIGGDTIEVEIWVRTSPDNPWPFVGVNHSLMSEDTVIAIRLGADFDSDYGMPNWEYTWVDGPYTYDAGDVFPIPEGNTSESAAALWIVFNDPVGDPLDTQGEWDYYGSFHMVTNWEIPDGILYPFSSGWYPHSGQGTSWAFENPPGGSVTPDQDFCGIRLGGLATEEEDNLPAEFSLDQNYPNPFNALTTIGYSLPEKSNVTFSVYNLIGQNVATLFTGMHEAGEHTITWDASDLPSGIYFARLEAAGYNKSMKMVLLK